MIVFYSPPFVTSYFPMSLPPILTKALSPRSSIVFSLSLLGSLLSDFLHPAKTFLSVLPGTSTLPSARSVLGSDMTGFVTARMQLMISVVVGVSNDPHGLGHLSTWSPVGGIVWRSSGRNMSLGTSFESSQSLSVPSKFSLLHACG